VDQYIGGPEHITAHLIYVRFYTKFLRDLGLLNFGEPALKYFTQGIVRGADGEKMSKSKGNIIEPLEIISQYGADALRFYLVSSSSSDRDFDWNDKEMTGSFKFLNKIYDCFSNLKLSKVDRKIESRLNKTIKMVSFYVGNFKHNLAIISLREFFSYISEKKIDKKTAQDFLKMLSIYCPFLAEELWSKMGNKNFISLEEWPKFDEKKIDENLEREEQAIETLIFDLNNILKIIRERGEKKEKAHVYVLPNEKQNYFDNLKEIEKRTGLKALICSVSDKNKHDPENKSKKVKPGKPGIYLE
jgi:leucyl-tRNA synthetase